MELDPGTPIKDFVSQTLAGIKAALPPGFRLDKSVDFDLSIVSVGEANGGADLRVVKFGGKVSDTVAQRVRFSVAEGEDFIAEAQKTMLKGMSF